MRMELGTSEYAKELRTAFHAAERASDIVDNFAENGFKTENKADGSKVTEADKKAQEKIVEIISEKFPDDGFLTEEDELTPSGEDRVWVIDPIDGTFNFDHSFSHYFISIALKIQGEIVLGVVYSPESSIEHSYLGVKNNGAYKTCSGIEEAEEISTSNQSDLKDSIFFLSAYDIYDGELDGELSILQSLAQKEAVHRNLGSCALEMCRVAAGEADFQMVPIVREWDYAAAKIIIEEAGGKVRIRESKFPKCTEVVSSNGLLHEKVEDVVGERFT